MIRMRTINEAYTALKEQDPHTAITPYRIRHLVKQGAIPTVSAGNKYLINMDTLEKYLANLYAPPAIEVGKIQPGEYNNHE